jgi:pimeloyl-ACP methyl ester carboxylesterase
MNANRDQVRLGGGLATLRALLRAACRWAPETTARLAARRFLRPRRAPVQVWRPLAPARTLTVTPRGCEPVRVSVYGSGPPVLLAHGWEGRGLQLGHLVDPLVAAGYSALVFDMPAHGASRAASTSALEFAETLCAVSRAVGSVHAVIGHSLGATAALLAGSDALTAGGMVLIAPMPSFHFAVEQFGSLLGLSEEVKARMSVLIGSRLNFVPEDLDVLRVVKRIDVPLLLIHDQHDRVIPVEHSERLAAVHGAQARLLVTTSLGHRRLLADTSVVRAAVAFVSDVTRPSAAADTQPYEPVASLEGPAERRGSSSLPERL